ncbi:MAG: mannanase [Clostridium sp.]|nr:mannanase [Clostridium sp.]
MKNKHMNRISLIMASSMLLSLAPNLQIKAVAAENKISYSNDFEKSVLPDEISGVLTSKDVSIVSLGSNNKALRFKSKFDGTDDWDNNKHELEFNYPSLKDLSKGAKVEYDILIPTKNKNFSGLMKSAGGFTTHDTVEDEWGWSNLDVEDIASSDFEDLGNGYSKKHISTTINEDVKGIFKLDIQIDAYNCEYSGYVYLDNVKVTEAEKSSSDKSNYNVIYQNDYESGKLPDAAGVLTKKDISLATVDGSKAMKVKSKFDGTDDWDSNKHQFTYNFKYSGTVSKNAVVEYDLMIPKANGNFDGLMKCAGGVTTYNEEEGTWDWTSLSIEDAGASTFEDAGNGYLVKHVKQTLPNDVTNLCNITLQIAGYMCTYAGDYYIDNVSFKDVIPQADEDNDKLYYANDYESKELPNSLGGVLKSKDVSIDKIDTYGNVLKINSKFDGTDDWDNNKHEIMYDVKSDETISKKAKLEYDIIIPTENKGFSGLIKSAGGFSTVDDDGEWGWVSLSIDDISSDDFTDLGNGYSVKHIVANPETDIKGLMKLDIQLDAYNCEYKGNIYIDNIKLHEEGAKKPDKTPEGAYVWNFDDSAKGLDGWKYEGNWAYKGTHDVSYDKDTVGSGALKIDVDYTKNSGDNWSELKIDNYMSNKTIDMSKYNRCSFDFYYNPANMTQGSFKTKLFVNDKQNNSFSENADIDFGKAVYAGNGLKKVKVTVNFDSKDIQSNLIALSVVGCGTDYKGAVYFDNITLYKEDAEDIYVDKTAIPTKNPTQIDVSDLKTPETVKLVDSKASKETASLFAYLNGVGDAGKVIYGHQNDAHTKAVLKTSGSNSDTKDVTGSMSGLVGIDTLSLLGAEYYLPSGDTRDQITAVADLSKDIVKDGGILTLSAHMPNFARVAEKGLKNGKYDYSGYTVNDCTGDVVNRILPGGDLNEVFTGYLDMIAEYGLKLQDANIPVLFRPFHENTGSWFWWGKAYCDEETYKQLYGYTVEYLRDKKGIHNFLYVYSPNGPIKDEADYLSRYPGDEFVDVMAFDMYHNSPKEEDPWFDDFKKTCNVIHGLAEKRGKVAAVAETGMASAKTGAMAPSGNKCKDWFSKVGDIVSEAKLPYFLVWANFDGKTNFFSPYMVSETRGHEMINNFIDFYNQDNTVFANGTGDYRSLETKMDDAYTYGYITSPASGSRVCEPATIKAKVTGEGDKAVTFKVKVGDEVVATLDGVKTKDGYEAELTQEILDLVGKRLGKIELYIGDKFAANANILFNMPKPKDDPQVVDEFEDYGDEDTLLNQGWSTLAGDGCSVEPKLFKDAKGNHDLAFNYKISTARIKEGYAGVMKLKPVDWSKYDALQFWCTPDGKGQKLVIQITCNGEDFEVHMPEFAGTTEPKLITLPFSQFKGKNGGKFDPAHIERIGIWCNTIVPEDHEGDFTVDSTMYFDNIKAVNTKDDLEVLIGDVDGNGTVNMLDFIQLKLYLAHKVKDINKKNADVDGNGTINVKDLMALRTMV